MFVGFLAPLLGIMFGFDAVSGERSQGTLPRLLSQPIHRDEVILGKFGGADRGHDHAHRPRVVRVRDRDLQARRGAYPHRDISSGRLAGFTIIYVGFWQALATLCSVPAKRASTSAMIPLGVWLVLTLFGSFIFGAVASVLSPRDGSDAAEIAYQQTAQTVSQLSPVTLFQNARASPRP